MLRRNWIMVILLLMAVVFSLFAVEKPKERLANEKGVEAEELWEKGEFDSCATAIEEAIKLFREAVIQDSIPADEAKIDRWLEIGFSAYVKAKDYENALRLQNERIERMPDEMDLYANKALLLKALDREDEALDVYKDMHSKDPDYKICKKIAKIYKDREDWENALFWYNESIKIRQDASVIKDIAVINLNLGRNEAAIKAYNDFLETNPVESAMIRTYKNLGRLYEDLNEINKALANYEKSLDLRFDSQIALLLIMKYYEMKDYEKSLQKIEEYLKEKPGDANALYYRAQIRYDQGDMQGARADYEAIKSDPRYSETAKNFIEYIDSL